MRRRAWALVGMVVLAHGVLLWAWLADAGLEVAAVSLVDHSLRAQGQTVPMQGRAAVGAEQGGAQAHDAPTVERWSGSEAQGRDVRVARDAREGGVGLVREGLDVKQGAPLDAKQGVQSVGVVDAPVDATVAQGGGSLAGGASAHGGSSQPLACGATHKALSAGTGVDVWVWVVRGAGGKGARFERAVFASEGAAYGEALRSAAANLRFVQAAPECAGVRLKVRVRVLA